MRIIPSLHVYACTCYYFIFWSPTNIICITFFFVKIHHFNINSNKQLKNILTKLAILNILAIFFFLLALCKKKKKKNVNKKSTECICHLERKYKAIHKQKYANKYCSYTYIHKHTHGNRAIMLMENLFV